MKELFEQVIQRRDYDLKSLLTCIDQYHIEGKLTDDERQELTQAAREGATAEYDYDRITAVQNGASLEWVATAENGWHAVVVNARVGWVSGKYSVME